MGGWSASESSFIYADTVSEATYQETFRSRKARRFKFVELIIPDNHKGLHGPSRLRGLLATLPSSLYQEPPRDGGVRQAQRAFRWSGGMFAVPSRGSLSARFRAGIPVEPEPSQDRRTPEEHIVESLSCPAFPESHLRLIRITNGLELFDQEINRRSGAVRMLLNQPNMRDFE